MSDALLIGGLRGRRVHLTGIKGVGMTALAEILVARGALVEGTDTGDVFFTDEILRRLGVTTREGFSASHLSPDAALVIYSAAYDPERHPELLRARSLGIPIVSYPEALGRLSVHADSSGVAGVHGKTTTSALVGVLARAAQLPVTVLAGSIVPGFDHHFTYAGGDRFFIAETCEYKRHFLNFSPARIIITSVEMDHQDYYRDFEDILKAFEAYALKLKPGGLFIYCADDAGATEVARRVQPQRRDVAFIPYGVQADGPYRILDVRCTPGTTRFRLAGYDGDFTLHVPGRHTILNAAAALALVSAIAKDAGRPIDDGFLSSCRRACDGFGGTRRRSEIVGEAEGILFMDDYAHHPTAVSVTLSGLREYHPDRRIIVDFMSHTYSRTRALLSEFAHCFTQADEVILHKIYASARETNDGSVNGRTLYDEVAAVHPAVRYFEEPADAFVPLQTALKRGDLFITMGAGDNWKLCHDLYRYFSSQRSMS